MCGFVCRRELVANSSSEDSGAQKAIWNSIVEKFGYVIESGKMLFGFRTLSHSNGTIILLIDRGQRNRIAWADSRLARRAKNRRELFFRLYEKSHGVLFVRLKFGSAEDIIIYIRKVGRIRQL